MRTVWPASVLCATVTAVAPEAVAESRLYKKIAFDLVFQSPQLQQHDFKANEVLGRLLGALVENYLGPAQRRLRLLPPEVEATLERSADEAGRRQDLVAHAHARHPHDLDDVAVQVDLRA